MAEKGQLATAATVVEIATARPDPAYAAAVMYKHRSLAPACKVSVALVTLIDH